MIKYGYCYEKEELNQHFLLSIFGGEYALNDSKAEVLAEWLEDCVQWVNSSQSPQNMIALKGPAHIFEYDTEKKIFKLLEQLDPLQKRNKN